MNFKAFRLKILIILCVLAINGLYPLVFLKPVFADNTYFAKIQSENIYLYQTPVLSNLSFNYVMIIPKTYFVELLSDENELFYKARYIDIYGYVLKKDVFPVKTKPIVPFADNLTFRVFSPSGVNLRSSPFESYGTNNLIISVPFLETNLSFYGLCEGEEAISKKGTTWYYCKYIKSNTSMTGYIYSALCDLLTVIIPNTEVVEFIDKPIFEAKPGGNQTSSGGFNSLSNPLQILIIVCACLPCLLIVYILFKPTKIATEKAGAGKNKQSKSKEPPKKIKRLKHSDYYEIDDDFYK